MRVSLRHFRLGKIIRIEQPEDTAQKWASPLWRHYVLFLPVLLLEWLAQPVWH